MNTGGKSLNLIKVTAENRQHARAESKSLWVLWLGKDLL